MTYVPMFRREKTRSSSSLDYKTFTSRNGHNPIIAEEQTERLAYLTPLLQTCPKNIFVFARANKMFLHFFITGVQFYMTSPSHPLLVMKIVVGQRAPSAVPKLCRRLMEVTRFVLHWHYYCQRSGITPTDGSFFLLNCTNAFHWILYVQFQAVLSCRNLHIFQKSCLVYFQ